jgi:hypothetical protein
VLVPHPFLPWSHASSSSPGYDICRARPMVHRADPR